MPEPTQSDSTNGPVLTWTLTGLPAGTHSLDFQLLASISEGSAAVSGEAHLRNGVAGTPVSATTAVADTQVVDQPHEPGADEP